MHIVVNALLVHGHFTGVQHVILHQLRVLLNRECRDRYTIIAPRDAAIEEHLGATTVPYTVLRAPLDGRQRGKRVLWEQSALPGLLAAEDAELYYAPGYLTSLRWDGPSVVFIHDTIALSYPHLCTLGNAVNYRLLLPPSARRATRVAVPSQASADEVARHCRVAKERIRVLPLGVQERPPVTEAEIAAARHRLGLTAPFLLAVSTIEPKKNFANLIRWFSFWKRTGIPHHLVIIGKWGWKCGDVRLALANARVREHIHLPGYMQQAELPAIMAAADLLLMPSRCEGFGLPALEGMAAGVPVVVSDRGSLPEVVGDAGLVLPLNGLVWRAEIPTLLNFPDRLAKMRAAGKARAAAFTWQRHGEQLAALFDETVQDVLAGLPPTLSNPGGAARA